jgi:GalNAc-alpha-(1->4)-GalNAc-alpha-(1->3)-diNAcBac-PP-undecaprenol alpha-1,4-N-acetyl-D-galactosaminyltransferase
MRFLFVIDHLNSGGAQRQMVNLAVGLCQRNHDIEFFIYHPQDFFAAQLADLGIKVHRSLKPSRYSIRTISSLLDLVKKNDYDFIVSFLKTPNFYAEVVKSLIGRKRPGLVVSERLGDSFSNRYFRTKALRQLHRLADYVTVNSHHQRTALLKTHAWMRDKISTIYNGVDLNVFYPLPIREKTGDSLTLLAVASITTRKNGLRLIKALEILRREYQLFPTVHWVGEHQLHIPERRNASLTWKEELKRLQLESQWQWLEPRHDIPQLMRSYDALIHPSYLEGLPNAVCEALASGLPALVSASLDHPLLVQNGVSGFLFDPFAPEAIAEAIYRFSRLDAAARQAMSASARTFAEKELAMERYVSNYEQLFISLMK